MFRQRAREKNTHILPAKCFRCDKTPSQQRDRTKNEDEVEEEEKRTKLPNQCVISLID